MNAWVEIPTCYKFTEKWLLFSGPSAGSAFKKLDLHFYKGYVSITLKELLHNILIFKFPLTPHEVIFAETVLIPFGTNRASKIRVYICPTQYFCFVNRVSVGLKTWQTGAEQNQCMTFLIIVPFTNVVSSVE
jgi:hypothetical protein